MNLTKLFKTQAELDKKIIEEKGLQGQDLLEPKILAMQTEIGELANEIPREFKFWSNKENNYEKALIEFVDILHFALSIGNLLEIKPSEVKRQRIKKMGIVRTLIDMQIGAGVLMYRHQSPESNYLKFFNQLLHLGSMLGFTRNEIEQAYYQKNKINHERQANGY